MACPATVTTYRDGRPVRVQCGAKLAFIGIALHRVHGWRAWRQCQSPYCGLYIAADADGVVKAIQKAEPPRPAFRTRGLWGDRDRDEEAAA